MATIEDKVFDRLFKEAEIAKVIARKMKSRGFSSTDISEMTGLTDEEVGCIYFAFTT